MCRDTQIKHPIKQTIAFPKTKVSRIFEGLLLLNRFLIKKKCVCHFDLFDFDKAPQLI